MHILAYPGSDDRLSHFDTIPACDRQTDRRTAYINNVRSKRQYDWRTLKMIAA